MENNVNKTSESIDTNDTNTFEKMEQIVQEQLGDVQNNAEEKIEEIQPNVESSVENNSSEVSEQLGDVQEKIEEIVENKEPIVVEEIQQEKIEVLSETENIDKEPITNVESLDDEVSKENTTFEHKLSETDLKNNPEFIEEGLNVGDTVILDEKEIISEEEFNKLESEENIQPNVGNQLNDESNNDDDFEEESNIENQNIQPNVENQSSKGDDDFEEESNIEGGKNPVVVFDGDIPVELVELIRAEHNFSFDSIGRHLKEEITSETLKAFHIDFVVAGICSSQSHYRILSLLNETFGLIVDGVHVDDKTESVE